MDQEDIEFIFVWEGLREERRGEERRGEKLRRRRTEREYCKYEKGGIQSVFKTYTYSLSYRENHSKSAKETRKHQSRRTQRGVWA